MTNDLLFLAHRIPYPPNKGDKLRSFHLLKLLSGKFRVHLGCFVDNRADWDHVDAVKQWCEQTYFVPLHPVMARLRSAHALLQGRSASVSYYRDQGLLEWVSSLIDSGTVDRALIFSSVMAQYVENAHRLRRVTDMVDVDSAKWGQYAKQTRWPLSALYAREAASLLAFETEIASRFDATVFVSKAEADLFVRLAAGAAKNVCLAGNGVDSHYFDPALHTVSPYEPGSRTLVFTGAMDYRPNIDAVDWFAREVFPAIHERWTDARFAIVGSNPSPSVRRLANLNGVLVTGTVPDVRPYLAHACAVVAPLRIARGVQNKVLEGMAMGKTVIASSDAVRGIDSEPGRDLLVADSATQYVDIVDAVFRGACDTGRSARKRILESYSWSANLARIVELLGNTAEAAGASDRHASVAA